MRMNKLHPRTLISRVLGFTLIELLIVIVIMGLLLSLVAPAMFSKVGSSQKKTAMAQMQMLSTALDTYRLDVGAYPKTLAELRAGSEAGWDGPYLPREGGEGDNEDIVFQ